MPDADLYRIEELPADELGGASGGKRKFRLEFIGKAPNERFPYTVANEVVSSHLGTVLGFSIPIVIPHKIGGEPLAMVLWMQPAARQQQGPPMTSRELQEFLASHADDIHGAIILDLFLANTDRSFGPERRNISVDDQGRLLLFDFGNALYYRHRDHLGIVAGIPRLDAVEQDLRKMFDKQEKNPDNYYFQLLSDWSFIEKWCARPGGRRAANPGGNRTSHPRGTSTAGGVLEKATRIPPGPHSRQSRVLSRARLRESAMNDLRYVLIRFVPDMARMEPINVGVVLQATGRIDFKLSPHAAKRKDVDTPVFQKWRAFFDEEIRGEAIPLLQPPKDSVQFLHHLSRLCEHTVVMTRPLVVSARGDESFETILQSLYDRLVAPAEFPKKGMSPRPTSQYRLIEDEKEFRKRGMRKNPYLTIAQHRRWNAYRQVLNGENIVIDKVEVGNQVGLTADEIQKLSSGVQTFLDDFLSSQPHSIPTRYFLIADELGEKFTDQSDDDFQAMQEEMRHVVSIVKQHGGEVLSKAEDVLRLAKDIDQKLPSLEELSHA